MKTICTSEDMGFGAGRLSTAINGISMTSVFIGRDRSPSRQKYLSPATGCSSCFPSIKLAARFVPFEDQVLENLYSRL